MKLSNVVLGSISLASLSTAAPLESTNHHLHREVQAKDVVRVTVTRVVQKGLTATATLDGNNNPIITKTTTKVVNGRQSGTSKTTTLVGDEGSNVNVYGSSDDSNDDNAKVTSASKQSTKPEATTVTKKPSSKATSTKAIATSTAASSSQTASSEDDESEESTSDASSFEDGKIKCSEFIGNIPNVVSLPQLPFGGWASFSDNNGHTVTECAPGNYCSYACAPGYSPSQWADYDLQPSSGSTLGGLICKSDGYLYRSRPSASELCVRDESTAFAKSSLGKSVAMCRTDYPGSENMAVPTILNGGDSNIPISVVNEDTFFHWLGKSTSAQYYLNNAGVSQADGCIWGNEADSTGNWSPLILGAGKTGSISYISLSVNPNNNKGANYNVKIQPRDGADVHGTCVYEDGKFTDGSDGCTVAVMSGVVDIVFS
ncbi:hypothetical protein TBLA_0D05570 [Henningerozyma blattae CBS 6284]|uniref:SUN domain-containing protein n=1 Tax=Henningerozyma blattae (strain ATCC 34711 / CBS 6284 / DSM 70876 / NBRC 10599 / NRRL Y-10934 / UCD 77-7) TaxID=1071380 RepID=I2H3U7_HENB6|nr:hypothetical protein TBLA_0D05570 [Tetrapisispora blattae CBS 6284]CCH61049.1 hypothetical protein TBLA_0D05570 [Tetrapisispora blattae CBS 6284]